MQLRAMTTADCPLGMRLTQQAGWNQTQRDWRRFLSMEPTGCFVAEWDGRPVATSTACTFGTVGWIAMVLVDKAFRGRGIGTALVQHALAFLDDHGVQTTRLDATPLGQPVYQKLGFAPDYELVRMEGPAPPASPDPRVRPAGPDQLGAICALDRQVTGTDRRKLLSHLLRQQPDSTFVFLRDGQLRGYLLGRDGRKATHIGPGIALDDEAGRALGDTLLAHRARQQIFIDVPTDNTSATQWIASRGLTTQRPFLRMSRGQPVTEHPKLLWASSGPEHG